MCISVYRERRIRKCCPTPRQPVRLVVGVDFSRQELLMAPNRRVAHHNQAATGGICTVAPQWGTARPLASMATSKAAAGPAALGTREVRPVAMCDRRWVRTLPVLRSGVSAANTPGRWAYSPSRRLTVPGDQTVNRPRGAPPSRPSEHVREEVPMASRPHTLGRIPAVALHCVSRPTQTVNPPS